jgi:hypothetical protein
LAGASFDFEPTSECNALLTGKNTGKIDEPPLPLGVGACLGRKTKLLPTFNYSAEQGICRSETGKPNSGTGNFLATAGITFASRGIAFGLSEEAGSSMPPPCLDGIYSLHRVSLSAFEAKGGNDSPQAAEQEIQMVGLAMSHQRHDWQKLSSPGGYVLQLRSIATAHRVTRARRSVISF